MLISGIAIFTVVLVTITVFGVSYYATSYLPRERVLFTAIYFIFITFTAFSISISFLVNNLISKKSLSLMKTLSIVIFLIFVVLLLKSFYSHWSVIKNRMKDYAKAWDVQEALIYEQKENGEEIIIAYQKPVGDIDGFIENIGWVSLCAAGYYEVEKITVLE